MALVALNFSKLLLTWGQVSTPASRMLFNYYFIIVIVLLFPSYYLLLSLSLFELFLIGLKFISIDLLPTVFILSLLLVEGYFQSEVALNWILGTSTALWAKKSGIEVFFPVGVLLYPVIPTMLEIGRFESLVLKFTKWAEVTVLDASLVVVWQLDCLLKYF